MMNKKRFQICYHSRPNKKDKIIGIGDFGYDENSCSNPQFIPLIKIKSKFKNKKRKESYYKYICDMLNQENKMNNEPDIETKIKIEVMMEELPNMIEHFKLIAKLKKAQFDLYVKEGFTEEQAMQLIISESDKNEH